MAIIALVYDILIKTHREDIRKFRNTHRRRREYFETKLFLYGFMKKNLEQFIDSDSLKVTAENSVGFHRTILAAWSPVMTNIFSNSWKEKNEGVLELPLELKVIKAFKKYVYIKELPEDKETLLSLVELGSYLMNGKLELDASKRVVEMITPDELWEVILFSVMKKTNHLTKLLLSRVNEATKTDLYRVFDQITKV